MSEAVAAMGLSLHEAEALRKHFSSTSRNSMDKSVCTEQPEMSSLRAYHAQYGGDMYVLAHLRRGGGSLQLARNKKQRIYLPGWSGLQETPSPTDNRPWRVDFSTSVTL